jgi:hypothetical protein
VALGKIGEKTVIGRSMTLDDLCEFLEDGGFGGVGDDKVLEVAISQVLERRKTVVEALNAVIDRRNDAEEWLFVARCRPEKDSVGRRLRWERLIRGSTCDK